MKMQWTSRTAMQKHQLSVLVNREMLSDCSKWKYIVCSIEELKYYLWNSSLWIGLSQMYIVQDDHHFWLARKSLSEKLQHFELKQSTNKKYTIFFVHGYQFQSNSEYIHTFTFCSTHSIDCSMQESILEIVHNWKWWHMWNFWMVSSAKEDRSNHIYGISVLQCKYVSIILYLLMQYNCFQSTFSIKFSCISCSYSSCSLLHFICFTLPIMRV